jgi:Zn-dependent peptidase ImmA (M78 family)/DNA-binding XRE family transcriptional regulator
MTAPESFNPVRLQLARERRRLLSKELADRCGVTPVTLSNWEQGTTVPSSDAITRIASELDFPEAFFYRPLGDRLPDGAANFRARTTIPARHKRAALAAADLACELAAWIERRFALPVVRLPGIHGQPPELTAQMLRVEWLLGERPAPNMIHLLESRGVLVFSLAQDCYEIDAFSFWLGKRPIVLLNTVKSAERSRFDAAHELFHLVAHREQTGKEEEQAADLFASAFLMSSADTRRKIPRVEGLNQLIEAKQRWGVSLAALVYRLNSLKIATPWQYRTLFIELSKRGHRSAEPNSIPREGSILLTKVFDSLRTQGIKPRQVATELGWPTEQLHEFLFGLGATMLGLDGPGGSGLRRGRLRLVL